MIFISKLKLLIDASKDPIPVCPHPVSQVLIQGLAYSNGCLKFIPCKFTSWVIGSSQIDIEEDIQYLGDMPLGIGSLIAEVLYIGKEVIQDDPIVSVSPLNHVICLRMCS